MTTTNDSIDPDPRSKREQAKAFARQHVRELAAELNHWQSKGVLPQDSRLLELARLCADDDSDDGVSLAETIAHRAIRDLVAQLPALPAQYVPGGEPWNVYDEGVGVTLRRGPHAADDISFKIVSWPGDAAERSELAQWLSATLNAVTR